MYSAVQRSVRAAMPCVSQHSRKRALSAANGRAGWRLVRLTSEASPRDSSGDLSPIFGADELGEMFRKRDEKWSEFRVFNDRQKQVETRIGELLKDLR